jgi:GNAT superfamily N-acetyltransferase
MELVKFNLLAATPISSYITGPVDEDDFDRIRALNKEGDTIGSISILPRRDGTLTLHLAVLPKYKNKGVGLSLYEKALEKLKKDRVGDKLRFSQEVITEEGKLFNKSKRLKLLVDKYKDDFPKFCEEYVKSVD